MLHTFHITSETNRITELTMLLLKVHINFVLCIVLKILMKIMCVYRKRCLLTFPYYVDL